MKRIELLLITFVFTLFLSACSDSNGDNEPDNPNLPGSTFESLGIKPSELPGTWLIEKIVDADNNATTIINQEITIDNFPIRNTDGKYVGDNLYEEWAETYDDIISCNNNNKYFLVVSYVKRNKANDSTARIVVIGSEVLSVDSERKFSFDLGIMKYENNRISGIGAISYGKGIDITVKSGTITMKKIR